MPVPSTFFVIGHPIGHSMSPFIHERLFALSGRAAQYAARDIPPERLAEDLPALLRTAAGCNVTIPHKQAVIPLLTELAGRAALYRSVNTIACTADGPIGYNTDADGFLSALRGAGIALAGRVLLLGCGGVGRTFACEAALAGCTLVNAVRGSDCQAAEDLCAYVHTIAPDAPYTITGLDTLDGDFDLLINATPVGMYPRVDAAPVDVAVLTRVRAVFDAVYNPGETRLLALARAAGAAVLGGMSMLVWQAAAAHTLWYGARFSDADIAVLIADAQAEMARLFPAGNTRS